jgi:hypothetical protein
VKGRTSTVRPFLFVPEDRVAIGVGRGDMKTSTLVALGLASSPMLAFAGAPPAPAPASQQQDVVSITMKIDGVHYTLDVGAIADTPAAHDKLVDVDGWALAYETHALKNGETIFDAIAYRDDLTCHLHGMAQDGGLTLEQAKVGLNACLSLLK